MHAATINEIDDKLLLIYWQNIFACANTWRFTKQNKQALIDAVIEFRFALNNHFTKSKQANNEDGVPILGADDIKKIIKACWVKYPMKLNCSQAARLYDIANIISTLATPKESGNKKIHGKEIKDFFWGGDAEVTQEVPAARSIYISVITTLDSIIDVAGVEPKKQPLIEDFSMAKNLIERCKKKTDYYEPLKPFQFSQGFINLALRIMHLACVYVIDNPHPTLFESSHTNVAQLLCYTNDLLIKYHRMSATKRTVELLSLLNNLDDGNGIFNHIINEINQEFFGGDNQIKIIAEDKIYKENHLYAKQDDVMDQTVELEEIKIKRNLIPITLVLDHFKVHPTDAGYLQKFINWFYNIFSDDLRYKVFYQKYYFIDGCQGKEPYIKEEGKKYETYELGRDVIKTGLFFDVPLVLTENSDGNLEAQYDIPLTPPTSPR